MSYLSDGQYSRDGVLPYRGAYTQEERARRDSAKSEYEERCRNLPRFYIDVNSHAVGERIETRVALETHTALRHNQARRSRKVTIRSNRRSSGRSSGRSSARSSRHNSESDAGDDGDSDDYVSANEDEGVSPPVQR